jgi:hypothetical protein
VFTNPRHQVKCLAVDTGPELRAGQRLGCIPFSGQKVLVESLRGGEARFDHEDGDIALPYQESQESFSRLKDFLRTMRHFTESDHVSIPHNAIERRLLLAREWHRRLTTFHPCRALADPVVLSRIHWPTPEDSVHETRL